MTSETPEQTAQTPKPYNLKPEAKVQRKAENAQCSAAGDRGTASEGENGGQPV